MSHPDFRLGIDLGGTKTDLALSAVNDPFLPEEALEDGEEESSGLAATGLCLGQDVVRMKHWRQGISLDFGHFFVAQRLDRLQQFGSEHQS